MIAGWSRHPQRLLRPSRLRHEGSGRFVPSSGTSIASTTVSAPPSEPPPRSPPKCRYRSRTSSDGYRSLSVIIVPESPEESEGILIGHFWNCYRKDLPLVQDLRSVQLARIWLRIWVWCARRCAAPSHRHHRQDHQKRGTVALTVGPPTVVVVKTKEPEFPPVSG